MAFWDIGATSVAGAALGAFGASSANKAAKSMQKRQMAFEREVMNNKYQWQVGDMKAAGLNPMLSVNATPPIGHGSTAQVFDEGAAAASGAVSASGSKRNEAESSLLDAQKEVAINSAAREAAQAQLASAQAAETKARTAFEYGDESTSIVGIPVYGMKHLEFDKLYSDMNLTRSQRDYVEDLRTEVGPNIKRLISESKLDEARAALTRAEEEAERLGLPRLRNEAASQDSSWKRNVSPYLDDLGKITNSAGDMSRMRRPTRIDNRTFNIRK